MKYLLTVLLALPMLASTALAQESGVEAAASAADLEKVKRAKFRETYVDTSVDFSRYNKLYLGDAYFDYRDVGPAERTRSYSSMLSSRNMFGISEEDRQQFEDIVDEAFMKEIVKGKHFTLTDTIDDQTIIMRGAVVDIVSRVPPEFAGRSEVYLSAVGEATLMLEFLDGKTGDVLALISERGVIGNRNQNWDFAMPANRVTVMADVRRWAASAAKRLRKELDDALGG